MFKPGDRVRRIKNGAPETPIGSEWAVEDSYYDGQRLVMSLTGLDGYFVCSDYFELVEAGGMPVVDGRKYAVGASLFDEEASFTPDATTGGVKGSKACRYDLIPVRPLAEVAAVLGKGAEKYEPNNWRKGYDWGKSYAAAQRHINRFWAGEETDPESGLHPLAHAIANLMFLIEFSTTHPDKDDRGDVSASA